jgi:hypothetical protein
MKRLLCCLIFCIPAHAAVLERSVDQRDDDAEEKLSSGVVSTTSSDLEMVSDRREPQMVGIRFRNLDIPPGANVTNAYVQFTSDEISNGTTNLSISAETSGNAPGFQKTAFNLTSRPQTKTSVPWSVPAWSSVGAQGPAQATPDIAAVVQEVVDTTWTEGDSLVIFVQGSGARVAESYSKSQPQLAAKLTVEFDGTSSNQAPVVDAGADIALNLPANSAPLMGSATDDGLPSNSLSCQWSHVGGTAAGTVEFTEATLASTSVTFSDSPGTFVLRLECDDGEFTGADELTVSVTDGSQIVLSIPVVNSADDVEERVSDGNVKLSSSDLELVLERTQQIIGIRFDDIAIPPGVTIISAHLQFTADELDSVATQLSILGESTNNAPTFTNQAFNISNRTTTDASVLWQVDPWLVIGQSDSSQRSPDLSLIVQEIINQPGWAAGSAMAFIIEGSGKRTAESFNGSSAPVLQIEFNAAGINLPPSVNAGANQTILLPLDTVSLNATVTDDGQPTDTLITSWSHTGGSGTGTVTFADSTATQTTAQISLDSGTYILAMTATDGALASSDQLIVTLNAAGDIAGFSQQNHFLTGFGGSGQPLTIPSIDPAGVYYHPILDQLFIMDSEINEVATVFNQIGANGFLTTATGDVLLNQWDMTIDSGNEPGHNREPTGITRCASDDHFYIVNDDQKLIYRYSYDGTAFTAVDAVDISAHTSDPEGITCDADEAVLYVLGGINQNIVIYEYVENAGFVFDKSLDLNKTAGDSNGIPSDAEGITLDPITGHLLLVSTPDKAIYEFNISGVFINKHDLDAWSPSPYSPQGITVGKSSNDPNELSVYVVDGVFDNDGYPEERDGRVYEARILRN